MPSAPPTSRHATLTMRANRGRDTGPELAIRSALHRAGWRFRVDHPVKVGGIRTRPDIVFTRRRVAVFVDGCFWHGCPEHMSWPKGNSEFWAQKIAANQDRDLRQTVALQRHGWTVIRVWEHVAVPDAVSIIAAALSEL